MKALVTGGGGFLGGGIVRRLLERGAVVRSFSRGSYPELQALGVEVLRGDLADFEAIDRACLGVDLVFHVGAKAGMGGPCEDYHRTNVVGTRNVIDACRRRGIPKLVYTSSPSVVFNGKDMEGVDESAPYPDRYKAPYPRTKALAEQEVLAANSPSLATVALRPHLVWGPGDNHILPRLLARGRAGQLRRIGTAPCVVDSTYIDNAVEAHLLAADRLEPGSPVAGKAYFISNGEPMPVWDLINKILETAGVPPVTKTISPRVAYATGAVLEFVYGALRLGGEPPMTRFVAEELSTAHWFDLTAARRDLGYEPRVTIEEGLQRLKRPIRSSLFPPR